MLHGLCCGEEAGARNLVFLPQCNGGLKLLWVCLCVRSYRVFWNLCLQIALEWLHDVARALLQLKIVNRIGVAASRLR